MIVMTSAVRAAAARLPRAPGVYRFRDAGDEVLYIGRAVDLRRCVGSYWGPLGDRGHLHAMVGYQEILREGLRMFGCGE